MVFILKTRNFSVKSGFIALYYLILFPAAEFLTFLDLQITNDYSAYVVGLFMVAFLYRVDWRKYVVFAFSGLVFFVLAWFIFEQNIPAPDRLLPILIFTLLSIYMVYSRESTRNKILALKVELEDSALKDPLTGLYNRRFLFDSLPMRISLHERYGDKTSLLMFDIDFFKKVNDQLGHSRGDDVLKTLSGLLLDNIRDTDTAFRYGGEEFLIVLNDTEEEQASFLAQRIRGVVETHPFESVPWTITVSIGVVELMAGENVNDLINRADNNLYKAKKEGRNRVVT